jgi:hypothetical protein
MSRAARSLCVALAAAVLAACGPAEGEVAIPDAAFVGSAACGSCHADQAAAYGAHAKTESMVRLAAGESNVPLLDAPIRDARTGFEYRVVRLGDGRLAQEERQLDAEGREIARLVRPMDWAVGSGSAARTYVAERGSRLVQLPLTWYAEGGPAGGGRWDFSPGYETGNPRFGRTIPERCLYCHNAPPETVPGVEDAFAQIPEGIGCESCHGPGSAHVAAQEAGVETTETGLVDLGALPLDLRLDVCQSCHLHGTVDVYRRGETPWTFRPGRPLSAHVGLFTVPALVDRGGLDVASHADRMRLSPCFEETQGTDRPLECTTCHDPHQPFSAQGPGAETASCRSCHAPDALQAEVPARLRAQHAPAADCVSCHMPTIGADGVPHASVTDHNVRVVRAGDGGSPVPPVGRSGVVIPLTEADREGDEGALYEGMAAVAFGTRAADPGAVGVGAQFIELALGRLPDPAAWGDAQFLLGVATLSAGRAGDALAPLAAAVEAGGPARAQRLETLARALADAGRPREAAAAFRQSVEAAPRRPGTRREHGRFLLSRGQAAEAARELRAALDLDPWDPDAHLLLGLADAGARDDAWREAVRLEPDLADAIANGIAVGEGGAAPLWTRPDVFGWPAASALPSLGRVTIYTTSGTPVARGVETAAWEGRDARGQPLAPGVYLASGRGRLVRFVVAQGPAGP